MPPAGKEPMETPEKQFHDYLKSRDIHYTWRHEAVCRAVFDVHNHFTRTQLADRLAKSIPATELNDILSHLIGANLIRKVLLDEDRVCFEHIYGHVHHDHLVCLHCGRIEEFLSPSIETLQEEVARRHAFSIVRHSMRIEGVCPSCRKTEGVPAAFPRERSETPGFAVPITLMESGRQVVITAFGCGEERACRLSAMGLRIGDRIEVAQNTFSGPLTIRVGDSRIAIDHELAHKILVRDAVVMVENAGDRPADDPREKSDCPDRDFAASSGVRR